MNIKVLGSGCKNCTTLAENVKTAAKELDLTIELEKVEDFAEIARYGVMQTPALVINEKVVSTGRTLKTAEVKKLLQKN